MLNSIGLQGPGIDVVHRERPGLAGRARGAHRRLDRGRAHRRVRRTGPAAARPPGRVDASRSTSPARTWRAAARCSPATRSRPSRVIGAVRRAADPRMPVFAKLSPDVTDIVLIARACADAGADGFSLINTLLGMVIDTDTLRAGAGRGDRRPVRPGDPAGRGALRLAGARRRCRTCRSSAWAASAPGSTRCSSCSPGRRRCRSARRCSATRTRRSGCCANWSRRWTSAASPPLTDAVGHAHLPATNGPHRTVRDAVDA